MSGFPLPFGGISFMTPVLEDEVEKVVAFMAAGCGKGHHHNVAIAWDAPRPCIYTSELGTECIKEALGRAAAGPA